MNKLKSTTGQLLPIHILTKNGLAEHFFYHISVSDQCMGFRMKVFHAEIDNRP